jgi:hypothetical protein
MADNDIDELHEKLGSIDIKYYNNLRDKITRINDGIVKQVTRDALIRSKESFQKGNTPEDSMFGIMYGKIAKDLLDTL